MFKPDYVSASSKAVLAYLSASDGIEKSWCSTEKRYLAEPEIARWHNCREQGYVISLRTADYRKQINIAFFEHRNSDEICAVRWEQLTINPPTIDTADFGDVYKDKYDVSHRESYTGAIEMAEWILAELSEFWCSHSIRKFVADQG